MRKHINNLTCLNCGVSGVKYIVEEKIDHVSVNIHKCTFCGYQHDAEQLIKQYIEYKNK
tara:strand:+ start:59845 stop:60021 length:177 start_codon:yes stop_codon:yes gene_type:complete